MTSPMSRPSEFNLPLSGVAVTAGPDGIGETPFDDEPRPEALEIEGDDPRVALRRTLGLFATGVTIITTRQGEQVHGMTANAFMSVSLEPSAGPHPGRPPGQDVRDAPRGEHVRRQRPVREPEQAVGPVRRPEAGEGEQAVEPRFDLVHDTPLVEGALAGFASKVVRSYWGGDHSLFLGRVEYAHTGEGAPLLFHGGRYERLGSGNGA